MKIARPAAPLQVPLGSVTPLAIASPAAKDVVLLLDAGIQQQRTVYVHPLVNTATLAMTPQGLADAIKCVARRGLLCSYAARASHATLSCCGHIEQHQMP